MSTIDLQSLSEPFRASEIEWRVQRASVRADGSSCVAVMVPFVAARAIMRRLDEICGPENWENEFQFIESQKDGAGFICSIRIRVTVDRWVTKQDGANVSGGEAGISLKGGFSGALKRAAVAWGMGRYLYDLQEFVVFTGKKGYAPKDHPASTLQFKPKVSGTGKSSDNYWVQVPQLPRVSQRPILPSQLERIQGGEVPVMLLKRGLSRLNLYRPLDLLADEADDLLLEAKGGSPRAPARPQVNEPPPPTSRPEEKPIGNKSAGGCPRLKHQAITAQIKSLGWKGEWVGERVGPMLNQGEVIILENMTEIQVDELIRFLGITIDIVRMAKELHPDATEREKWWVGTLVDYEVEHLSQMKQDSLDDLSETCSRALELAGNLR